MPFSNNGVNSAHVPELRKINTSLNSLKYVSYLYQYWETKLKDRLKKMWDYSFSVRKKNTPTSLSKFEIVCLPFHICITYTYLQCKVPQGIESA